MKNLRVTDKELLTLLDAVNLLQSASIFTRNKGDLYERLGQLIIKIADTYKGNEV